MLKSYPINYFRLGSLAGKQRPENVGAVVRLLDIYGVSVRLCCRAS